MPSPSELNRNRYLENFSTAAFSSGDNGDGASGFLSRALFGVLPVDDDAGKYHEINMDDVMRDEMRERAPGGARVMSPAQVARFIQHYERLTCHILAEMPPRADLVIRLGPEREVLGIVEGG